MVFLDIVFVIMLNGTCMSGQQTLTPTINGKQIIDLILYVDVTLFQFHVKPILLENTYYINSLNSSPNCVVCICNLYFCIGYVLMISTRT